MMRMADHTDINDEYHSNHVWFNQIFDIFELCLLIFEVVLDQFLLDGRKLGQLRYDNWIWVFLQTFQDYVAIILQFNLVDFADTIAQRSFVAPAVVKSDHLHQTLVHLIPTAHRQQNLVQFTLVQIGSITVPEPVEILFVESGVVAGEDSQVERRQR
jgi:hypothetical protein